MLGFPGDRDVRPTWSPDGRTIAVFGFDESMESSPDVWCSSPWPTAPCGRAARDNGNRRRLGGQLVARAQPSRRERRAQSALAAFLSRRPGVTSDQRSEQLGRRQSFGRSNDPRDGADRGPHRRLGRRWSGAEGMNNAALDDLALKSIAWAGDNLVYTSRSDGNLALSFRSPEGEITEGVVPHADSPSATSDGRTIVHIRSNPAWRKAYGKPNPTAGTPRSWCRTRFPGPRSRATTARSFSCPP
jgi:WD40-like Beta Propeller Repeat